LKKRYGVLLLLTTLAIVTFLDRISIAAAGPRIQQDLHIGPERWGWILGAFILAYGIFEVPTGALGDRSGQRSVLTRIVLWWSVFTSLTGAATGFVSLLCIRFLFGMGEAGAYPNMSGAAARWFPAAERARTQGFVWAASRLGGALAPLLVVPLQSRLGWRWTFLILGAVGIAWALCWRAWYHDSPAEQPGITTGELDEIGAGEEPTSHIPVPWNKLLRARQLWLICAMYWCYAWGSWFYFGWFPVYLVKGAGFTEAQMGIFSALPFLLGAAGNLVGGFLSDRLVVRLGLKTGRRLIGCLSLATSALLLIGMTLTRDHAAIVALSSLGFGVADLMLPTAWAICLDVCREHAGVVTGFMNTSGQLGGFVCSVLFGYVVQATGSYNAPVWIVGGMVLIAAVLFARIDPTRRLIEEPAFRPLPFERSRKSSPGLPGHP
jgi:MFS transporter, ACS family, glucarate transporter